MARRVHRELRRTFSLTGASQPQTQGQWVMGGEEGPPGGVGTARAGPAGSLESRTSTRSGAGATCTQSPLPAPVHRPRPSGTCHNRVRSSPVARRAFVNAPGRASFCVPRSSDRNSCRCRWCRDGKAPAGAVMGVEVPDVVFGGCGGEPELVPGRCVQFVPSVPGRLDVGPQWCRAGFAHGVAAGGVRLAGDLVPGTVMSRPWGRRWCVGP